METLKNTNGNDTKLDKNDKGNDTKKAKKTTGKKDNENAEKLAHASPVANFIGFYRRTEESPWNLHPQMLGSEKSVVNKIKLTYGECDIHIINVDFPK